MNNLKISIHSVCCVILMGIVFNAQSQTNPAKTQNKMDSLMLKNDTATADIALIDSLELVGVGISVETWRNHSKYPKFNLWNAIKDSKGGYIISQDQKQYPSTYDEAKMMTAKRNGDCLAMTVVNARL